MKLLFFILTLFSFSALAKKKVILIKGVKNKKSQNLTTGQSFTLKNDSITDQSLKEHITERPSLAKEQGFSFSPNDFYLPKIRGQRPENSEIWLGESLIYDPWLSLPLSSILNPKQFDQFSFYQGLSPYSVSSLNPFGALSYEKKKFKTKHRLGLKIGEPYGKSLWTQVEEENLFIQNFHFGFFSNFHQTEGDYLFYDDKGAPFNPDLGASATLEGNQQKSYLVSPYSSFHYGLFETRFFSFIYGSEKSLPSLLPSREPKHLLAQNFIHQGELHLNLKGKGFVPYKMNLTFNYQKGLRHLTGEPDDKQSSWMDSYRLSLSSRWLFSWVFMKSSFSFGHLQHLKETSSGSFTSNREYLDLYLAYQTNLDFPLNLENKYQIRYTPNNDDSHLAHLSYSFILFHKQKNYRFYFQFAQSKRLPSLLEEYGDGYSLTPSEALKPEENFHFELGFLLKGKNSFSINIYLDLSHDKINFLPGSFKTYRAQNLKSTRTLGGEASHTYSGDHLEIFSGVNLLDNRDNSNPQSFVIPKSPLFLASSRIKVMAQKHFFEISNRFTGAYFNDLANMIRVNSHLITNLSLGSTYKKNKASFSVRINLNNLFDVNSFSIKTFGKQGKEGRIARNEIYGFPLPGRSISLEFEAKL